MVGAAISDIPNNLAQNFIEWLFRLCGLLCISKRKEDHGSGATEEGYKRNLADVLKSCSTKDRFESSGCLQVKLQEWANWKGLQHDIAEAIVQTSLDELNPRGFHSAVGCWMWSTSIAPCGRKRIGRCIKELETVNVLPSLHGEAGQLAASSILRDPVEVELSQPAGLTSEILSRDAC